MSYTYRIEEHFIRVYNVYNEPFALKGRFFSHVS